MGHEPLQRVTFCPECLAEIRAGLERCPRCRKRVREREMDPRTLGIIALAVIVIGGIAGLVYARSSSRSGISSVTERATDPPTGTKQIDPPKPRPPFDPATIPGGVEGKYDRFHDTYTADLEFEINSGMKGVFSCWWKGREPDGDPLVSLMLVSSWPRARDWYGGVTAIVLADEQRFYLSARNPHHSYSHGKHFEVASFSVDEDKLPQFLNADTLEMRAGNTDIVIARPHRDVLRRMVSLGRR